MNPPNTISIFSSRSTFVYVQGSPNWVMNLGILSFKVQYFAVRNHILLVLHLVKDIKVPVDIFLAA